MCLVETRNPFTVHLLLFADNGTCQQVQQIYLTLSCIIVTISSQIFI